MSSRYENPWETPRVQIVDWDPDDRFLQICDPTEAQDEDTMIAMVGPCDLRQWA